MTKHVHLSCFTLSHDSHPLQTGCEGLVAGVTPAVELQKILDFFWHHLERDFEILCIAIGKSFDEAALLVHIVVQNILNTNPIIG